MSILFRIQYLFILLFLLIIKFYGCTYGNSYKDLKPPLFVDGIDINLELPLVSYGDVIYFPIS